MDAGCRASLATRPLESGALDTTHDNTHSTVRLDLWLWAARFFRTRALAKQAVETGKVEVGGQRAKPARTVRVGDAMRIERASEVFEIAVLGISDTRGPATAAQALYEEGAESQVRRSEARELARASRNGYRAPESKPDKRARRLIRALGDIEAS